MKIKLTPTGEVMDRLSDHGMTVDLSVVAEVDTREEADAILEIANSSSERLVWVMEVLDE